MSATLTEIEFVFENCEIAVVPAKYINQLEIAEKILIKIDKAAVNLDLTFAAYDKKLFDRIRMWEDITSFKLRYSDGKEETIYPRWEGDPNDVTNLLEKSRVDDDGNLIIKIG